MPRLSIPGLLLLIIFWPLAAMEAADKPVPAAEAASKFTLPKGFKATLFAGEPDIVQPIAFTFDDRGRMWVVECMMYPKWSQDGKGGKDRVVILEDTDGDGIHDKKTVVIDNAVNLSGIELGFGGVYLCSSPNLIFIPIKDDKPAGKPEILLDGWNIKDAKHNIFNSLTWGPDGWLYGCNGIQTKSRVGRPGTPDADRIFFDCGVWRYHPTRNKFEVVANGTTNPFGLDFDEHGEMFITNCVIDHLWHVVPGGHYTRMYGIDPNPNVYGYMKSAVDYKHWGSGAWTDSRAGTGGKLKKEHDDAGGGHAHAGAAIYLGDNFPREYHNTLFTCNIHGNRLNHDGLEVSQNGMRGVRRPDFLFANDPWFRGICVKVGPDGGLYISDWSDTGECHNYQTVDASNGRIYRVIYGHQKGWKGNIGTMSNAELISNLLSTNEWLARRSRLQLQERAHHDATAAKAITDALMKMSWEQSKPIVRNYERQVWALMALGGVTHSQYLELAKTSFAGHWLLRAGVEAGHPEAIAEYINRLKTTESVGERLKLISLFHTLPLSKRFDLKSLLAVKATDDHNLAWMTWYALEPLVTARPNIISDNFLNNVNIPLVRQNIIRRYMSINHASEADAMRLISQVIETSNNDAKRDILLGIKTAYADRPTAKSLPRWGELGLHVGTTQEVRNLADELSVKFGDAKQIEIMKERINQSGDSAAARANAIRVLSNARVPGLAPILRQALADDAVRGAAIRALAAYADDATAASIMNVYAKLNIDEKADAIQTLASRPAFAKVLLAAVETGTVPKTDISAFTARQIVALKDKTVAEKLKLVWGDVRPASATRAAQIAKYKELLTPASMKNANLANGRAMFARNCAACHKLFGEGQSIGPELTGSQRANLDYVLENVVDPSAIVANEYKITNFYLADGRIVSGIIRQETAISFTVRTVNEELVIVKKELQDRKPTNNSIMPDGLFDAMKPDDVRDLVAYLASKEQVPLPR